MPKRVYLDNNVVIDLKQAAQGSQEEEFLRAVGDGKFKIVLSSTHHLEAARAADDDTAAETADFLDSLSPLWLRERIALYHRELKGYLRGVPGDLDAIDPICLSLSEMASEVCKFHGYAAIMNSRELVRALRKDSKSSLTLAQAYAVNSSTFRKNVEDHLRARITPQRLWETFVVGLGKHLGLVADLESLRLAPLGDLRAVTVEFLLGCEHWSRATKEPEMRMSSQRLLDSLHLAVALPYADCVVSRDKDFIGLVKAIQASCSFSLAAILPCIGVILTW